MDSLGLKFKQLIYSSLIQIDQCAVCNLFLHSILKFISFLTGHRASVANKISLDNKNRADGEAA